MMHSRAAFARANWAYQLSAVLLAVLWCLMPAVAGGASSELASTRAASLRARLGGSLPVEGRGGSRGSHKAVVTDVGQQATVVPTKPEHWRGAEDQGHKPKWKAVLPSATGCDARHFAALAEVSRASVGSLHRSTNTSRGPPVFLQLIQAAF